MYEYATMIAARIHWMLLSYYVACMATVAIISNSTSRSRFVIVVFVFCSVSARLRFRLGVSSSCHDLRSAQRAA